MKADHNRKILQEVENLQKFMTTKREVMNKRKPCKDNSTYKQKKQRLDSHGKD